MTPIGNSCGEMTILAVKSAMIKNPLPTRWKREVNAYDQAPKAAGSKWGMTNPTKPIVPETATAAPVKIGTGHQAPSISSFLHPLPNAGLVLAERHGVQFFSIHHNKMNQG